MLSIFFGALLAAGSVEDPAPGSEVVQEVVTAAPQRITAAYVRMHAPEVVLSMARDVKAGRLDRRELEAVAGPKATGALLAAKLGKAGEASTAAVATERKRAVAAPSGKGTLRPTGVPAGGVSFGTFRDDQGVLIDLTADYAPSELAFPSLWEGERSDMLLLLHPTTSGHVMAKVPEDRNFQIAAMRVYDGLVSLEPGPTGLRRMLPTATTRTEPPWMMEAAAGQTVGVLVRFAPTFHIVENGAGKKSSLLEVSPAAPAGNIAVPIKGRFRGRSLGVLAFPDEAEITVITPDAYWPNEPQPLEAPVELVNSGDAVTGTIRPLSLPEGVSMNPFTVSLDVKASRVVKVPLRLSRDHTHSIWGPPYEVPYPIFLEVEFGGRKSQVGFYVVMYPSLLTWYFSHEVGSCDVGGNLFVYGSGNFRFSAWAFNNDLVVHRQVLIWGGFDGRELINMGFTAHPNETSTNGYGFHRQYYEDNFTGLVHKGLALTIKVRYPS